MFEEVFLLFRGFADLVGQSSEGPSERRQHFLCMSLWKEVHRGDVVILPVADFQFSHEPSHRHPEIIAHHHDALHPAPSHCRRACTSSVFSSSFLACSHCSNWSRTISTFLPSGNSVPSPQRRQRLFQAQVAFAVPDTASAGHAADGSRFPPAWPRCKRDHVFGESRQQARFDQRRLATARWPVDQAHRERIVGIGFLDASLPEPQAVGQSLSITGTGQQLQKEVGVMSVKRPQALGHDP